MCNKRKFKYIEISNYESGAVTKRINVNGKSDRRIQEMCDGINKFIDLEIDFCERNNSTKELEIIN